MRFAPILLIVASCVSCSSTRQSAVSTAPTPATQGPVITRLVSRCQVIVIRAGHTAPTYSLETPGGKVLIPATTADQLAMTNPDLLRQVRTMQANVLWASCAERE